MLWEDTVCLSCEGYQQTKNKQDTQDITKQVTKIVTKQVSATSMAPFDAAYFDEWTSRLQDQVRLPSMTPSFVQACRDVELARKEQHDTEKLRDELSKNKTQQQQVEEQQQQVEQQEESLLQLAEKAVTAANEKWNAAMDDFRRTAASFLDEPDMQSFLGVAFAQDKDLMTLFVLQQHSGKQWAAWSNQATRSTRNDYDDDDDFPLVVSFLQNKNDLLQRVLQAGGPRHGAYGPAIAIFHELLPLVRQHHAEPTEDDAPCRDVLERLALAVALELCDSNVFHFDSKTDRIQPVPRYKHYQDAFLNGELDPAFEFFTTWELRHVVNCDARNEELAWGRESLKNFRPGLVYLQDPKWRYNRIVKTDIPHLKPDWYKEPKSYDQILSGGGKCGPRAWYGRFICKAFGVPTWGAKQPGHAAMARWTPSWWTTCLGAAFRWNSWEGRCGLDFQLETQVRRICKDDEVYRQRVSRLEWVAALNKEDPKSILANLAPTSKSPWYALALAQRQRIVASHVGDDPNDDSKRPYPIPQISKNNHIQAILEAPLDRGSIVQTDNGDILISAAATSQPKKETRTIFFPKSFLNGGQQLLLPASSSVEYTIPRTLMDQIQKQSQQRYLVTCRVCTVHRNEDPLTLTLRADDNKDLPANTSSPPSSSVEVPIPYTMGRWQETDPVLVVFPQQQQQQQQLSTSTVTLVVKRTRRQFAVSIKDFRLSPAP